MRECGTASGRVGVPRPFGFIPLIERRNADLERRFHGKGRMPSKGFSRGRLLELLMLTAPLNLSAVRSSPSARRWAHLNG